MATVVESEFTITGDSTAVAYSEYRAFGVSITITPPTLPPDFCPETWQELVNAVFAFQINLPAGYVQIVVSDTEPIPEDRDKIWFKIDADGRIIGIYSWSSTFSAWLEYRPKEVFYAVNENTATANADILTTLNGTYALAVGQWFTWVHAVTNTGALTATVNGSSAVPVTKPDASAFDAGEVPENWRLWGFYDGTQIRVISPWKIVVPTPPTPTPPNIVSPPQEFPVAPGILTSDWAPDVTWAHGLSAKPAHVFAELICIDAITQANIDALFVGFSSPAEWASAVDDRVRTEDIMFIEDTASIAPIHGVPTFFVKWDDTNCYLKYNGPDNGSPGVGEWTGNFAGAGTFVGRANTYINAHWEVQFTVLPQV